MKTVNNSYPLLRDAKVISASDPEKLGRAQLKVYPELAGIPDNDCPWCFPHSGGVHGKSFALPPAGKLVSCIVWNRFWNEITFLPFAIANPSERLYDDFMKNIRPLMKDVPADPEEEHFAVERFEDGFSTFHDTKNKQHGWVHPSGAHFTVNELGDMFLTFVKLLTIHNGGDSFVLEINPQAQSVKLYHKGSLDFITGGSSKQSSADADIESDAPLGLKGGGALLGSGNLKPYWEEEKSAWANPMMPSFTPAPPVLAAQLNYLASKLAANACNAASQNSKILK